MIVLDGNDLEGIKGQKKMLSYAIKVKLSFPLLPNSSLDVKLTSLAHK